MILLAGTLTMFTFSCKSNSTDNHNHSEHEAEHRDSAVEQKDEHHHDDGEISLSHDAAERFGVTVEKAVRAPFNDVLKVSGVILASPSGQAVVSSPASGIITFASGIERGSKVSAGSLLATVRSTGVSGGDVNLAAKAAYESTKRELERLKPLYEEKLVTAGDYNAALRAYEEAKAAYSANASSGRIISPISGVVTSIDVAQGQYVETGTPVANVTSSSKLTLRADIPEKYFTRVSSIVDASIRLPYTDSVLTIGAMNGNRVSPDGIAKASVPGYIPLYFTFDNDGNVLQGSNVEVFLKSSQISDVISVPLTALSEQQGQMYVFVRIDDDCYRKLPVRTGSNDGQRIEILSGLDGGEDVVVTGTTTVRIAESSGVIPEGHNHNH